MAELIKVNRAAVNPMQTVAFSASNLKVACATCNLRELCLPVGLSMEELDKVEELVAVRRKIKRGDHLFRSGDKFESLYALRRLLKSLC